MDEQQVNSSVNADEKLLAALSYLWILSVIMLLLKKQSSYIQFHARQGVVLMVASIIFWFIPFLGWLLNFVILVLVIVGFIQALNGARWKMPVIGDFAQKIQL